MPADDAGDYDLVIHDGVEHLIPLGEEYHAADASCECEPLRATIGRTRAMLHRTLALPR